MSHFVARSIPSMAQSREGSERNVHRFEEQIRFDRFLPFTADGACGPLRPLFPALS
uniref:Uncharacterized protein n=1 Tax=Romanomermis culicivorax TaxID=13658 RepID=A0A915IL64_ROMCU